MRGILTKLYNHTVVATMVTIFFCLAGVVSAFQLIREGFPEIPVDTVLVEMTYLGADPYEVEEGIARKIEEAVDGLEGVKRFTTVSIQNTCRTVIEVKDGYPMDKALDNIRNAVDAISNFPVDAEKPIISEITIRGEVIFVALWGTGLTERIAKETAEEIKDELQALPEISQVSVSGVRDYEIAIELSEEKMRQWGLTFDDVSRALQAGSVNLSGGTLRTKGEEIDIKAEGRKYTGEEFSKIVVVAKPTGEIITLDQIAQIRDTFTEDDVIARFNGEPAVMIGVFKTDTEDSIRVAKATHEYVKKRAQSLPLGLHLTPWNDDSTTIEHQLDILIENGLQGLVLVIFTMWVFMGFRLSFWVAMGIPVAVSGALTFLYLTGGSLNIMTLLGMILVMGILVDDGIVISESIFNRRWNGERGLAAAVHGIEEVGVPIIAAVATTVVAFIPLFFIPSVIGKFVAIVPGVVISALMVDMFEATTCLPAHLSHLPDPHTPPKLPRWLRALSFDFYLRKWITGALFWFIDHVYRPFVYATLRHRYVVLACGIAFVIITIVGMLGGGFVKFILFPAVDNPFLEASIEFPQGTPLDVTVAALAQTEEAIRAVETEAVGQGEKKFVKHIYSVIGQGADPFEARASGSHVGVIRVEMTTSTERTIPSREVVARWQKTTGNIPGAVVQAFGTQEQGPPGAPIQIWLEGGNIDSLTAAAGEVKAKLRGYGGLFQIEDDFRAGNREIKVDLKPEARGLGLTLNDLASQVHSGFFGEEAIRVQRGRDDIRVKVRYNREERDTMADLDQVRIRTQNGQEVPFFSVANVRFGQSVASIIRVDGQRTIAVSAEVDEDRANAEEVLNDVRDTFMPGFEAKYPDVRWSFEGAKQDSNDAFKALVGGFAIALLAIYLISATTFRSYLQPFIVMTSIPFGMTGAIYGHWAMNMPLSMFSVFGMVSLAGVAVNDSIVLVEAFNVKLSEGRSMFDALADAGARRFRSIFLTTFTTTIGTAPLIFEKDLAARGMIPMALSMSSGLLVACVATLVLLPALFAIANDVRRVMRFLWRGYWPNREEVEPGSKRRIDRYEEDIKESPVSSEPSMVK